MIAPAGFCKDGGHSGNGGETRVGPAFYGIGNRLAQALPEYPIDRALIFPISIHPKLKKLTLDDGTPVDGKNYQEKSDGASTVYVTELDQNAWKKKSCYEMHLLTLHEIFIHLEIEPSLAYPFSKPAIDRLEKLGRIHCPDAERGLDPSDDASDFKNLATLSKIPQGTTFSLKTDVEIEARSSSLTFHGSRRSDTPVGALKEWGDVVNEFVGCEFTVQPSPRRRYIESGLLFTIREVVPESSGRTRIRFYESSLGDLVCSGVYSPKHA